MPYPPRISSAGLVFHVLNRGVRRLQLFDRSSDYRAFLDVFREAQERIPIRCLAFCLMPNHFHLVLWPSSDTDLPQFMGWLTTTHAKRWHGWRRTTGTGHVYQARYKSFAVCTDSHFFCVCRYVERNAARAALVARPEDWPWSSLAQRAGHASPVKLAEWPVERPPDWMDLVQLEVADEIQGIRQSIVRGSPYGPENWQLQLETRLQLDTALRTGRARV